jgi:hypothetical protein
MTPTSSDAGASRARDAAPTPGRPSPRAARVPPSPPPLLQTRPPLRRRRTRRRRPCPRSRTSGAGPLRRRVTLRPLGRTPRPRQCAPSCPPRRSARPRRPPGTCSMGTASAHAHQRVHPQRGAAVDQVHVPPHRHGARVRKRGAAAARG